MAVVFCQKYHFVYCCVVFKVAANWSFWASVGWCDTSWQSQCSYTATAKNAGNMHLSITCVSPVHFSATFFLCCCLSQLWFLWHCWLGL